ncbi:MAG: transposase [Pseudanabaena sp. CAN_BIN31]|nr:transposase [Pseudanabaena sp. CAN_BIN31]
MSIAEREQQILRVKKQGFHKELDEALADKLKTEVVSTVKTVLESALEEEVKAFLKPLMGKERPHRSGYYHRGLNTQYGQIQDLAVPKLRQRNREREWQVLQRYERSLGNLLDWMCCLYVMGLSLRDLLEALYFILGKVLSVSAQITLKVQQQLEAKRQKPLTRTPEMILVDGVWVDIQYTINDEFKEDQSGHIRQCRRAEERVVLAVMAVWEDGSQELIHYEVASVESEATWTTVFQNLIARGLDPNKLKLVSSDGGLGLPAAMQKCFPIAQQQRCITHKVRGIERHLNYSDLPQSTPTGQPLKPSEAKQQRRFEIISDAYRIYEADLESDAQLRLQDFQEKWQLTEPDAVRTFIKDVQLTFSFYQFDADLHHHIRTTNHLERLFREFRTKSDEIGAFPNETSCLTVFWLVVERDHAKHDRRSSANNS